MKIRKCYIASFGKLKDFSVDFDDKLTIINEENGFGKTTLATFIKAIFYGLNDSKKSVEDNERLKYRPWNSTQRFGGYAIIEKSGKTYKIERYFGTKASEDTVSITDVETGKSYPAEDIGKNLFQIDEEGFLSTTYFSQKDFEVKSNASITAKYNETCSVLDAEQFEKTVAKLETQAKEYKMRGDKGLISDVKKEIRETIEKIEEAKGCKRQIEDIKVEVDNLSIQAEKINFEMNSVNEKIASIGRNDALILKKETYARLQREYDRLNESVKGAKKVLNGQVDKARVAGDFYQCSKDLSNLILMERGIIKDIEQFSEYKTGEPARKQNASLTFGMLFGGFFLLSLVAFFINNIFGFVMLFLAVIFGVVALVFLGRKGEKTTDNSTIKSLIDKKKEELSSCRELIDKARVILTDYLSCFNVEYVDFEDGVKRVEETYRKLNADIVELNKVIEQLNEMEKDKNLFSDFMSGEDDVYFRDKSLKLTLDYSAIISELAQKRSRISTLQLEADKFNEYEIKLAELKDKLVLCEREYEVICLTVEYLKKANENLKAKYRKPLQESLLKFVHYIAGEGLDVEIDVDLKVRINEKGFSKDVDYYSKGYKNLLEICKRFSLIDVLFAVDKPFIVLDDPFVNLDDAKLQSSLSLVRKLSNEYQIIYFICHDSRTA